MRSSIYVKSCQGCSNSTSPLSLTLLNSRLGLQVQAQLNGSGRGESGKWIVSLRALMNHQPIVAGKTDPLKELLLHSVPGR